MAENITQKLIEELDKLKGEEAKTAAFIRMIKKANAPLPPDTMGKMKAIYLFGIHIAKNPKLLNEKNRETIAGFYQVINSSENRPVIGNHRKK